MSVSAQIAENEAMFATMQDEEARHQLYAQCDRLMAQAKWLEETIIEILISEAQNAVADFKKWNFDIDAACISDGDKIGAMWSWLVRKVSDQHLPLKTS